MQGGEAQLLAHEHAGIGTVSHAVHVLAGIEAIADLVLISLEVLGQRTEHENAVDLVVLVDLVDDLQEFLLGDVLGQNELLNSHAQSLGALGGAVLVAQIVGTLAAANDGQSGVHALGLQSLAIGDDAGIQLFVDFLTE